MSPFRAYAFAFLAFSVAILLRLGIDPWLGRSVPYPLFSGDHGGGALRRLRAWPVHHALIAGLSDTVRAAKADQWQLAALVESSDVAQAKIVDDILDLVRGMGDNLRVELKPFDLVGAVHRAIEAVSPGATGKMVQVDVRAPQPVPIVGDPARVQQVVWNVFDKFRQADASFTRQHGGLGLGLAIARHRIELHGGSIEARSAGEGSGSTFVVRLPLPARDDG